MAIVKSTPAYVLLYLLFMLPTYVLPYFGSNSHILRSVGNEVNRNVGLQLGPTATYLHIASLGALVLLAYVRGKAFNKAWIAIFPFLALVFDMLPVLTMIPLIPTVLHLLAVVLGVAGVKSESPKLA